MYRCSDHDPVIIGLHLGDYNSAIMPEYGINLSIFPNPATDFVTIVNAKNYRIRISDMRGQIVVNEYIDENEYTFSSKEKGLFSGVYILYFKENKVIEPKTIVLKLIIN